MSFVVAYSFPHFVMAAVSYDADVARYEAGSDSIAGRARSWEDWVNLVRAMLPKGASLLDQVGATTFLTGHSNIGRRRPIKTVSS